MYYNCIAVQSEVWQKTHHSFTKEKQCPKKQEQVRWVLRRLTIWFLFPYFTNTLFLLTQYLFLCRRKYATESEQVKRLWNVFGIILYSTFFPFSLLNEPLYIVYIIKINRTQTNSLNIKIWQTCMTYPLFHTSVCVKVGQCQLCCQEFHSPLPHDFLRDIRNLQLTAQSFKCN